MIFKVRHEIGGVRKKFEFSIKSYNLAEKRHSTTSKPIFRTNKLFEMKI